MGCAMLAPGVWANPLTAWRQLSLAGRCQEGAQSYRRTSDLKRVDRLHLIVWVRKGGSFEADDPLILL